MARGERSEDQTSISLSISKALLAEVNKLAAEDGRPRSNWISRELQKIVEAKKAERDTSRALPGVAAADPPSSSIPNFTNPRINELPEEMETPKRRGSLQKIKGKK